MERRDFIALLGGVAVGMPAQAGPSQGAQRMARKLSGTWAFVSAVEVREDGGLVSRWDADAKGTLMIDGHGYFSQVVVGSESWVFGAKSFCSFGTYTFDEPNSTFATRIEGSSIPRLVGITQRRIIAVLTADELRYTNLDTASGAKSQTVWRRLA